VRLNTGAADRDSMYAAFVPDQRPSWRYWRTGVQFLMDASGSFFFSRGQYLVQI
jgi:hypothetical protein